MPKPEFRRRHVGTLLVDELVSIAKEEGLKSIRSIMPLSAYGTDWIRKAKGYETMQIGDGILYIERKIEE